MQIEIQKNVPLPEPKGLTRILAGLEIGDMIEVDIRHRSALGGYAKNLGYRFKTSQNPEKTKARVWRIA